MDRATMMGHKDLKRDILLILYYMMGLLLWPLAVVFLLIKAKKEDAGAAGIRERLGILCTDQMPGDKRPRVWFHAASIGEAKVAIWLIEELIREGRDFLFFLSTNTPHGKKQAMDSLEGRCHIFYAPLDVYPFVKAALKRVRPNAMVFVETELWPCWINEARKAGARLILVNGRISPRSFKAYLFLKGLLGGLLDMFHCLSMIGESDKDRILKLGAKEERVKINGNIKADPMGRFPKSEPLYLREELHLRDGAKVLVAGSIRGAEIEPVVDAYQATIQGPVPVDMVIAPRHLKNVPLIENILEKRGLAFRKRSNPNAIRPGKGHVIILDSMGELSKVYGLAHVVFLGASLVPLGGQNPVEPALWGKPILHGPSIEDFEDMFQLLLKNGGSRLVNSAKELAEITLQILADPILGQDMGEHARQTVYMASGATRRHAASILKIIEY